MTTTDRRIAAILGDYQAPNASAPGLMCDRHPADATAFRIVDEKLQEVRLTFGELAERSRKIATVLHDHGVRAGDRVATLMGKDADLPAIILGIWRVGAVYAPLFTAFASAAVADRLEQAGVRVVVTDAEQVAKVPAGCTVLLAGETPSAPGRPQAIALRRAIDDTQQWDAPAPTGPAVELIHMFTSGTTGKPKTVVHPLTYAAGWQAYLEFALGVNADSTYWNAADPGWAFGLYAGLVAPMAAGIEAILFTPKFDAEATWRLLDEFDVTDFAAAPTVFRALRACPVHPTLPHLERLSSAGEPLTPDVLTWAQDEWGLLIHDHFGQTELGMPSGFPHHPDLEIEVQSGSMGRALPGWSLTALALETDDHAEVGQVGRLAVRIEESPLFTFTGYGVDRSARADRFSSDGAHYLTGDLVTIDDNGLLRFASRDDDVILMAGYRIGPFDVESALASHDAVLECAVVATPDEMRGEVIHAFVVTKPGTVHDAALVKELQQWVRQNYAAHAYPRRIDFVASLPKTPSGKIQRSVLRQSTRDESSEK